MNRMSTAGITRLLTAVFAVLATLPAAAEPEPAGLDSVVEGNTAFALEMHRELSVREGNLFFSPYSVSSALGMTYAGARGHTAQEMQQALRFPAGSDALGRAFGALQAELNAIQQASDVKLSIANAIWTEQRYRFLPDFLKVVQEDYKSKISTADFAGNAEAERKVINTWVEQQTNHKIKELVPAGVLSELTRMVLVNAIYFKGDWAHAFEKRHTRDRDFQISAAKKVTAKMMHREGEFRLAEDADTQALAMPYRGDRLSMLVLLPKEKDGIERLEKTLTPEKLNGLIERLRKTTVGVTFPKFKVETRFDLVPPFQALGLQEAFDGSKADFSGMDGTRNLVISGILHKAFVEVDEQGTEAAAATAVTIGTTSIRINPRFTADHPFLFLIRDTGTGSILFMGRVTNPAVE